MGIGEIIFLFLASLATSYSFLGTMVISILKELGNNGYMIKEGYKLSDLISQDKDIDSIEVNRILMTIPLINLIYSFCLGYIYACNKDEIFDKIMTFDSVREMTYEELIEYHSNQSLLYLLGNNKKNNNKDNTNFVKKELSFLEGIHYDNFKKELKNCGYLESDVDSSYYAISNCLFKMKASVCMNDFCLEGEEAEKYCKILVNSIAEQLGENNYAKLDIGYFIKNSISGENTFEELQEHIRGLYANYDLLKRKIKVDIADDIVSLTKDKAIFVSIKSGDNYRSFILNYDMFKKELEKQCLTITGIENLTYEEFIMQLINERVLSLPVAVSKQKIEYRYYDSFNKDDNDNTDEDDKPKVMKKTKKEKTKRD